MTAPTVFLTSPKRPGIFACTQAAYLHAICHEGTNELTNIGYKVASREEYLALRLALSPDADPTEITNIVMAMP